MRVKESVYTVYHYFFRFFKNIKRKYHSTSCPETFIGSDRSFIMLQYKEKTGKLLNLRHPVTLVEKLMWLKLYDRNPLYTVVVDKWASRDYIKQKLGYDYSVPLIGTYWEDANDIDFSELPDKCVLKCNHLSDVIVYSYGKGKSKSQVTFNNNSEIVDFLNNQLRRNYFYKSREWPYKNVKPKIICEKYLENSDGSELVDYKFYCYSGKVRYFMYSVGEINHSRTNHKFDVDCNSIDYLFKETPNYPLEKVKLPDNIYEMIDLANKLCVDFPQIRIDMYNIDGRIYIGELTFFSSGGFIYIKDEEYAQSLADLIDLNKVKKRK